MTTLFIILQYLLPHHLLSRLTGKFASSTIPWLKNVLIKKFIKTYQVNMEEAENPDPSHYACFNDFFTRSLNPKARSIDETESTIISPADGAISALGDITNDRLIQAKGKDFSLTALLGGSAERAQPFAAGKFATVYLSPKDYHRVHIPLSGTLKEMIYIPGRLFSVNQATGERIPDLFARNERAVCIFDTQAGPMAVVLVGAMIVAGIETVWAGQVAPARHGIQSTDYANQQPPIHLQKGLEMGRFKLGSTAIVLFGPGMIDWQSNLDSGSSVQMGQVLGRLNPK